MFCPFLFGSRCCASALAPRPALACSLVCTVEPTTALVCDSVHVNETVWPEPCFSMVLLGRGQHKGGLPVPLHWDWNLGYYPLISTLFISLDAPTNLPSFPLPLHFLLRSSLIFLTLSKPSQAYRVEGLGVGSSKKPTRGPSWGKGLSLVPLLVNFLSIPHESMCDVIFLVFWTCRSVC